MDSSIKRKYFVPGLYQKHRRVPKILNNYEFDSSYLQKPRENFTAKCKLCGKTVRASMRVTTNFVNHVKKFHPSSRNDSVNSFLSEDKTLSPPPPTVQLSSLDTQIVSTLIKCCIPLAVLDMSSFKNLLIQLNPEVSIFSQSKINNQIIPHLVEQTKIQILDVLSQTSSLSLVLDYWSVNDTKYISIHSNLIDTEWKQQTVMLDCQQIFNIEDINYLLENCLMEYKITGKVYSLCLTSSNGLALKPIMEILALDCIKFYSCSMLLDKVLNHGLKNLSQLQSKKLVSDKNLNLKSDLDSDCELAEDISAIYRPFNELKDDLEKDSASVSVIYPAFKGLQTHLSYFKKFKEHDVAKELEKSLEEKLGFIKSMPVFSVAAMLNPNFGLSWIDEQDHSSYEKMVTNEFFKEAKVSRELNYVKDVKISAPRKSYLCLSKTIGGDNEYSNEMNSYIMYVKAFSYDENFRLLDFWKSNEKTYPHLSNFVRKILSVSIGLSNRDKLSQDCMQKMDLKNDMSNLESILFLKFNNSYF